MLSWILNLVGSHCKDFRTSVTSDLGDLVRSLAKAFWTACSFTAVIRMGGNECVYNNLHNCYGQSGPEFSIVSQLVDTGANQTIYIWRKPQGKTQSWRRFSLTDRSYIWWGSMFFLWSLNPMKTYNKLIRITNLNCATKACLAYSSVPKS